MTARTKLAPAEPMTIKEFLAFTDTRPQEGRWELIEGVAAVELGLSMPLSDIYRWTTLGPE